MRKTARSVPVGPSTAVRAVPLPRYANRYAGEDEALLAPCLMFSSSPGEASAKRGRGTARSAVEGTLGHASTYEPSPWDLPYGFEVYLYATPTLR